MSIYLGVHKFPKGTKNTDIQKSWEMYKKSADKMGLRTINAVVNGEMGLAYCFTEAESADQVHKAHSDANVPIENVIEVSNLT